MWYCKHNFFPTCQMTSRWSLDQWVTWLSGYESLTFKSTSCLVWCPRVFCSRKCKAFTLSRDLTWPPHWWFIWIDGWQLLVVYHHPDKSVSKCDYRHYDSANMFLICHVISLEDMFKVLCEFSIMWVEAPHKESPPCHIS